jgi:hypothetical protein
MKDMKSLLKNVKIEHVVNRTADGQATTTSSAIDMASYEGAMAIIPIGVSAANGVVTAHLEQSSDNGVADDYSDVEGSEVTGTNADNTELVIDLAKASKRYVKVITVTSTGDSEIGPVLVLKYGASKLPVVQGANITDSALLAGPAEGTP